MSDWGISEALRKCFKCLAPTNHSLNVGYDYYHYVCAVVKWPQLRREKNTCRDIRLHPCHFPLPRLHMVSHWFSGPILDQKVRSQETSDVPRGPVSETLSCQCRGCGFDPWLGNKDSHMPGGTAKRKNKKKFGGKLGLLHFYRVFPQFKPESGVVDV